MSLFAEQFNEMLMRDFGFNIYKGMSAAPEKPKEEKKDKEKKKDERKDSVVCVVTLLSSFTTLLKLLTVTTRNKQKLCQLR